MPWRAKGPPIRKRRARTDLISSELVCSSSAGGERFNSLAPCSNLRLQRSGCALLAAHIDDEVSVRSKVIGLASLGNKLSTGPEQSSGGSEGRFPVSKVNFCLLQVAVVAVIDDCFPIFPPPRFVRSLIERNLYSGS
jgi:hypothetical protein